MENGHRLRPIGHLYNDFPEKFGLPRQSGLAEDLLSVIVLEPEFRTPEAFRGIEQFERLWLLWEFEGSEDHFSPTVRPPRLGGNERVGVFATRSPNRPNHLGLTCVKLLKIQNTPENGPMLTVAGADIRSGTAIWDIKPYIPYADSYPHSRAGFADSGKEGIPQLSVVYQVSVPASWTETQCKALTQILSQDPRPAYQHSSERSYAMSYAGYTVRFSVSEGTLTVTEIIR